MNRVGKPTRVIQLDVLENRLRLSPGLFCSDHKAQTGAGLGRGGRPVDGTVEAERRGEWCVEERIKELNLLRNVNKLVMGELEEEQQKTLALKLEEWEEVAALRMQPLATKLQLAGEVEKDVETPQLALPGCQPEVVVVEEVAEAEEVAKVVEEEARCPLALQEQAATEGKA